MPCELRGLSKLAKEQPEKKIDRRLRFVLRELKNFSKLGLSSNWKKKGDLNSKRKLKNQSSKPPSGNRDNSSKLKIDWRRRESIFC